MRWFVRRCGDPDQVRRLLAIALILDGGSRSDAAKVAGVTLQIVRDWVLRFNADGPDGLAKRKAPIAAIDGGMSCRAAAAHFDVSISSAIRWRCLALQHGRAVAKPRGGDRHSGRIEAHCDFIKGLLAEQGDITLVEIQARLTERGVPVTLRAKF
ncbi:MAG: hypothetical protein CVT85_12690 [Alphaproteobacteria bacterium HGW-Alphaproteobacteria-7]|nr:MAG: hypothetical protein CVT85_12690 [Alphaproteobacteria bacterium HGW-Alphaproteobacteria-7]